MNSDQIKLCVVNYIEYRKKQLKRAKKIRWIVEKKRRQSQQNLTLALMNLNVSYYQRICSV